MSNDAYLQARLQRLIAGFDSARLPMLIDVLRETLYTFLYSCVHGLLHFWERQDGRTIDRRERLMCLRCLFEKVHDLFELIFRARYGIGLAKPHVQNLEEDVILVGHVVRTAAAVLHGRGEANIGRRLREYGGVQLIISKVTEDGFRSGNVGFVDFSLGRGAYGSLKMEFL